MPTPCNSERSTRPPEARLEAFLVQFANRDHFHAVSEAMDRWVVGTLAAAPAPAGYCNLHATKAMQGEDGVQWDETVSGTTHQ